MINKIEENKNNVKIAIDNFCEIYGISMTIGLIDSIKEEKMKKYDK